MKALGLWVICMLSLAGCSGSGPSDDPTPPPVIYTEQIEISSEDFQRPDQWWQDAVFYEVFVRSYKDSDGDGHGDIQGLIGKLDYLQTLGVNALWLMPITESFYNSNGYDVAGYRTVETDYGSEQDFRQLIAEAHQRGIRIIIDYVINHSSNEHPFFQDAITNASGGYKEWYVWSQQNPGWQHPWQGNAPVWHASRTGYYYGLFYEFLPDWNFTNPSVLAYTKDTLKFWLNMGVDGFRFDAVHHLVENGEYQQANQPENHQVYREIRLLMDQYQQVFSVAEAPYTGVLYLGDGTDEFHSTFCFECLNDLYAGIRDRYSEDIHVFMQQLTSAPNGARLAALLSNHDPFAGVRPYTAFAGDLDQVKLAAAVLLASPGIPFIYYGEEIAMASIEQNQVPWPDAVSRTPMQWDSSRNAGFSEGTSWRNINDNYAQFNVANQQQDSDSVWHHYQKLIAARKASVALSRGDYSPVYFVDQGDEQQTDRCVAFIRQSGSELVLGLINLSDQPLSATLDLSGTVLAEASATLGNDLFDGTAGYAPIESDRYSVALDGYAVKLIPITLIE